MANQFEKRRAKERQLVPTEGLSIDIEEEKPIPEYTSTANDIVFNPSTRRYSMVTVDYNLTTGEARVKEVKEIGDSGAVANKKIMEILSYKMMGIK